LLNTTGLLLQRNLLDSDNLNYLQYCNCRL